MDKFQNDNNINSEQNVRANKKMCLLEKRRAEPISCMYRVFFFLAGSRKCLRLLRQLQIKLLRKLNKKSRQLIY